MSEQLKPLSVAGVRELLRDHRRRIVAPDRFVPALAELHYVVAQLFEAIATVTSDERWLRAAELVRRARDVLRDPSVVRAPPLLEDVGVFEGLRAIARKGMAWVVSPAPTEPWLHRKLREANAELGAASAKRRADRAERRNADRRAETERRRAERRKSEHATGSGDE